MFVNKAELQIIRVRDISSTDTEKIALTGAEVRLCRQKTGHGFRRLFICPKCGVRCLMLYGFRGSWFCRSCLPLELYCYRRNMYDEGGTQLITWHMRRLMASVGINEIKFPFDYRDFLMKKPRYIRWSRWETTVKKVQMLENMRFCVYTAGKRFTAADIKAYTSPGYLDQYAIWEIMNYLLFATREECLAMLS